MIPDVADAAAAHALGPDYVRAVGKIVASHVRNELAGAVAFDEPAIALAPGPEEKWLACRIAMEEYGHHLKFQRLATDLGLETAAGGPHPVGVRLRAHLVDGVRRPESPRRPGRGRAHGGAGGHVVPAAAGLVTKLLPEEHFHVSFGMARTRDLVAGGQAGPVVQQAVDDLVAFTVPFFGRSVSANNESFRRWGVKHRTNDEARADWAARGRRFVEGELGLRFPDVDERWNG